MKDKRILFIGGNRGMGLATAKIAHSLGAEVIIASRDGSKSPDVVNNEFDGTVRYHALDAGDLEDVRALLKKVGLISDIVVTATGSRLPASSILKTPTPVARQAMEGLWIAYNVVHLAKEYVQRNGSITLLSGSSAKTPGEHWGFWGIAQGAINSLVRFGASELAPIRVNAVSPGGIGAVNPDRQLVEHHGTPEDVGQMMIALISNPHVTGAVVDVDGGERQGHWNG
jgi:NAD(P)-dependent dehydrogenase (short-subunit alcohol dehydrogenase family)